LMNELSVFETLPAGFLEVKARDVHKVLPGPSIIHLKGKDGRALFLSVLLHGNEDVGLIAVQQYLLNSIIAELPRDLIIFVGNVSAAAKALRRLDDQPDFNRVWPGSDDVADSEEHRLMCNVIDYVKKRPLFASIDLHNNTGLNPHYACVNRLDQRFFHLATLFSRIVVFFIRPLGVQSMAMAEYCPSVTIECGRSGDKLGYEHAQEYISAVMHLTEFPEHPVAAHDMNLYHTVATVKIPQQYSFGFDPCDDDVQFVSELDHLNFRELPAGTTIGKIKEGVELHFDVVDENGNETEGDYFRMENGNIMFARDIMPSMFTLDKKVIRQDCLCYLMEKLPL